MTISRKQLLQVSLMVWAQLERRRRNGGNLLAVRILHLNFYQVMVVYQKDWLLVLLILLRKLENRRTVACHMKLKVAVVAGKLVLVHLFLERVLRAAWRTKMSCCAMTF